MHDSCSSGPADRVDAALYPEVARYGSLVAAIEASARSRQLVLSDVRPITREEPLSSAVAETGRRSVAARLRKGERKIFVQLKAGNLLCSEGSADDFEEFVSLLNCWENDTDVREVHAQFSFLTLNRLAVPLQEGRVVEYQWSRVADDAVRSYGNEPLRDAAIHARRSAVLSRFCPHLAMGTMVLSSDAEEPFRRDVSIAPVSDGTIHVGDHATSLRLVAVRTPEEAVAVAEEMAQAVLRAKEDGTIGPVGLLLQLHPKMGIGDLRFGRDFRVSVMNYSECFGPVRVLEREEVPAGSPASKGRVVEVRAGGEPFEMVLTANDEARLVAAEVFPPRDDAPLGAEATLRYEDFDVFRTPARELAEHIGALGREVVWDSGGQFAVPGDAVRVYRNPAEGGGLDPEDGLPLYATSVLVATGEYFERAEGQRG